MLLRFLRGLLGSRRPEELALLGQRAFEAGNYAVAADHLSKALPGLPPTDGRRTLLSLQLAIALQECQRPAEAEGVLKDILAREPDCPGALMQLAMLRFIDSDTSEARRLMDRYVARHDDAASRLRRALMTPIILESGGEIDELRRRLEADLDRLAGERLQPMRHPEGEVLLTPFYLWGSSRHFLGFDRGEVVVYRGLPYAPLGLKLNEEVRRTGLEESDVEERFRDDVENHKLYSSEEQAEAVVRDLEAG